MKSFTVNTAGFPPGRCTTERGNAGGRGRNSRRGRGQYQNTTALCYCHLCGVTKGNTLHNSKMCTNPKEGHQIDTMFANMMGDRAWGLRG
eukprot:2964260-Ditylum_brightwellii.AAC.1